MKFTVRLDPESEARLLRLSHRMRLSKSEVVRKALRVLDAREDEAGVKARPYDVLKPYIGMIKGGRTDLSVRTGEKFRRLLEDKRRLRSRS